MRSGSLARSGHRFDVVADGRRNAAIAGDRGDDPRRLLAGSEEPAIAGAATDLSLPGKVTDGFGGPSSRDRKGFADAGRRAGGPRPFDQHAAGAPIGGEGEAGTSNPLAGRARG